MLECAGVVATPRAPGDDPAGPLMTLQLRE